MVCWSSDTIEKDGEKEREGERGGGGAYRQTYQTRQSPTEAERWTDKRRR